MKYFLITAIYENQDKWTTRRDTFKDMNKLVKLIMKADDIVKFTVEERTA